MKVIKKVSDVIDKSKKPKIVTKDRTLAMFLEGDAQHWYRRAFIVEDLSGGNDTAWEFLDTTPKVIKLTNDYFDTNRSCYINLETLKKVIIKLYGK